MGMRHSAGLLLCGMWNCACSRRTRPAVNSRWSATEKHCFLVDFKHTHVDQRGADLGWPI